MQGGYGGGGGGEAAGDRERDVGRASSSSQQVSQGSQVERRWERGRRTQVRVGGVRQQSASVLCRLLFSRLSSPCLAVDRTAARGFDSSTQDARDGRRTVCTSPPGCRSSPSAHCLSPSAHRLVASSRRSVFTPEVSLSPSRRRRDPRQARSRSPQEGRLSSKAFATSPRQRNHRSQTDSGRLSRRREGGDPFGRERLGSRTLSPSHANRRRHRPLPAP